MPFQAACRALLPLAFALWGIGIASAWLLSAHLELLFLCAALGATSALVTCWASGIRHDAERRALLRLITELSGPGETPPSLRSCA